MRTKPQIGLLINEIGNLYQKQVWRSLVDSAGEHGMQAVGIIGKAWKSPEDNEWLHNQLYRLIPFLGLDAYVVAKSVLSTHDPFENIEEVCGLDPTRTIYLGEGPSPDSANIVFDASTAIHRAMEHLVNEHGCKKIACVTGTPTNPDTMTRLVAWRGALQDLGIALDPTLEENGAFTNERGGQAALSLLARHPDLDAIFFMNDTMAIGAMEAFENSGIELNHVRMVGMDDIEEARWVRTPLTTIRQPLDKMSRRAVERACEKNGAHFGGTETFYASLVIRETCGCKSHNAVTGRDSFIHEQMQVFFQSRKIRRAAQTQFSDLEISTWDARLALSMQRAGIRWAGVLEWKRDRLPEGSLESLEFHRWIEYQDGKVLRNSEQKQAPAEILTEKIHGNQAPCLLFPLVCESRFLGVILLEYTKDLENFYEPLILQAAAALQGTWLLEIQRVTQQELLAANQQLMNLSNRDELTGVLNRRGFMLLAEQALLEARREKTLVAIIFADMDKLKTINDVFGHAEGDRAIRAVSQALKESLRQTDIMARIGGDEFVIFARVREESDVRRFIHRANAALAAQESNFPNGMKLGFSAGITFCKPQNKHQLDELLQAADAELYLEKERRHSQDST